MGCGVLTILLHADFYSVPIICGLDFSLLGLYFWLSAKRTGKESGETVSASLVHGILVHGLGGGLPSSDGNHVFLSLPLFWEEIKEKEISKA